MIGEGLADLILEERTRILGEMWKAIFDNFFADLVRFAQPLGHGTTSNHLESILQYGLGGHKPANASSPHLNSVCDLKKPDGLIACYAFATWNRTDKLAIESKKVTGRDVIDRYAKVNPLVDSWLKKFILRRIAKKYIKIRGAQQGHAVLLVYDCDGSAICNYRNSTIPSEIDCKTIIDMERLKYVFVSAARFEDIKAFCNATDFLEHCSRLNFSNYRKSGSIIIPPDEHDYRHPLNGWFLFR